MLQARTPRTSQVRHFTCQRARLTLLRYTFAPDQDLRLHSTSSPAPRALVARCLPRCSPSCLIVYCDSHFKTLQLSKSVMHLAFHSALSGCRPSLFTSPYIRIVTRAFGVHGVRSPSHIDHLSTKHRIQSSCRAQHIVRSEGGMMPFSLKVGVHKK